MFHCKPGKRLIGKAAGMLILLACLVCLFFIQPASALQTIRFGVNPWGPEAQMREVFRPVMDYLQEQLGIRVDIVIPKNYEELITRTANGDIDLASFNAVALLKARHAGLPIKYLVTTLKLYKGETEPRDSYTGYIIVRSDSPYRTLDDLRGKTFAFVDTDSSSGYKMPMALLATSGLGSPEEFFKKFFFVGDHDEVISSVYNKCVDGGATWDNSFTINTAPGKFPAKAFRIIHEIPQIPNDAWMTGPKVNADLAQKIKNTLLSINVSTITNDGRIVLNVDKGFPGTGWTERSVDFYELQAKLLLYTGK